MHHPDLFELPEWTIQVFEELTGLQVVVHDLSSELSPFLQPERFKHRSACCLAVKARHDTLCVDFEITRLRREIQQSPEGRYHSCHAGLMEWVVPCFIEERLAWILFAGQRKAAGIHRFLVRDSRTTPLTFPGLTSPAPVEESSAQSILESLRQLRSRLLQWHDQASLLRKNPYQSESGDPTKGSRRLRILNFIHHHHRGTASLADLARLLNLGESRTSHLVKELFGCSYVQLLMQKRLRTAASLLRESSMPILDVCLSSGFQDLSHFHRCFQRRFATTPLQYRRMSHA